ncbi:MAG TPA: hydantoinase/carbamoylase family amidase [Solirubrobacteraceae bacterium]|nr:hydantoinase/carbamoylase family amidase [Solirubrobacteraceae bacterium]
MPSPDGGRVAARLEELWEIARGTDGGASRLAYSKEEAQAVRLAAGWAREAGLEPALDPHGNLWAAPTGVAGPLVSSGSHLDTVPDGGRFDGALGVVLALEAAEVLPGRAALLVCAAEEAPRFGAGTIGSRLATGALDDDALVELVDADGMSAREGRGRFLAELADLPRIDSLPFAQLALHVEVHVEQRRELHRHGARLGVVERVAVPHRHEIVVEGRAGHAGEVPMQARADALAAAAELVLALEQAALAAGAPTVATAGTLRVEPGAVSVIPGRAVLGLEVRGTDAAAIARVEAALAAAGDAVAARRGVRIERRLLRGGEPAVLDAGLVQAALAAAERRAARAVRTYSGAGHDAQHLASRVPVALLFVPLAGGESHTPEEHATPEDVELAAAVLVDLLATSRVKQPD